MMWGLFFLLVLLIPLLAVILDSQLGRALARRIEGGAPDSARLARLEAELDRLSAEIDRLQEQAEFTTKLLEERREVGRLGPGSTGAVEGGGEGRREGERPPGPGGEERG